MGTHLSSILGQSLGCPQLANGATLPEDGFTIDNLKDVSMQHLGYDGLHDVIKSVDAVVQAVKEQGLGEQNQIGMIVVGPSIETSVDISSLGLSDIHGEVTVTATQKHGVATDFDMDAVRGANSRLVSIMVDENAGGTIKTDTDISGCQTNVDAKEFSWGIEKASLYIGDAQVAPVTQEGTKYYEIMKDVQVGDLRYKILAKVYIGREGEKLFTSSKTTIIRSDNTFAVTETDLTSLPTIDSPEVTPEKYAEVSTLATLNNEGVPAILGEEILSIHKELYALSKTMEGR